MEENSVRGKKNGIKFDRSEAFEKQIAPIIRQLEEECLRYRIPMFVTAAVSDDGKETTYRHTAVMPETLDMKLSDNLFNKELCVVRGFDVFPQGAEPFTDEEETSGIRAMSMTEKLNSEG